MTCLSCGKGVVNSDSDSWEHCYLRKYEYVPVDSMTLEHWACKHLDEYGAHGWEAISVDADISQPNSVIHNGVECYIFSVKAWMKRKIVTTTLVTTND